MGGGGKITGAFIRGFIVCSQKRREEIIQLQSAGYLSDRRAKERACADRIPLSKGGRGRPGRRKRHCSIISIERPEGERRLKTGVNARDNLHSVIW